MNTTISIGEEERERVAACNYPDPVKGCGVDRGRGRLRRFIRICVVVKKEKKTNTNTKTRTTNGEMFHRKRLAMKKTRNANHKEKKKTKKNNAKHEDDSYLQGNDSP